MTARAIASIGALLTSVLLGHPASASPRLAALVPADDARQSLAIGPAGEVYEPDGKGAWIRHHGFSIAATITAAARGAVGPTASGGGAVFRLADNGWSAIRLAQHGTAVASSGRRAVAAIGREVFELDKGAEPTRLVQTSGAVVAIAATTSGVVLATDHGVFRIDRGKLVPVTGVPAHARLISDRWALVDGGAFDLRAGKTQPWPADFRPVAAAATPDGGLAVVASHRTGLELIVVRGKLDRELIPLPDAGVPVAVVVDAGGRAVIALADGRLVVRDHATWSTLTIVENLPAHPAGPPPAKL